MPKRSNPFQQVVTLLHKQFSGGTVTESKFLPDSRTGKPREVDIVIEAQVADYSVLISIECVDRGRRANVEWVERMSAKHEDLPTNKLVLISSSGFTPGAERKAQALNITTLALAKATAMDWTLLVGKKPQIGIETLESHYQAFIVVQSDQGQGVLAAPRDLSLLNETGTTHVVLGDLLDKLVALPEVGDTILNHMESTDKTQNTFTLEYEFSETMLCRGPKGETLATRSLRVVCSSERELVSIPLIHGELREAGLAFGEFQNSSKRTRVAVVERNGVPPVVEVTKQHGTGWKLLVNADSKTPGVVMKDEPAT